MLAEAKTGSFELCDHVAELPDGLDLFVEALVLDEVRKVNVALGGRQLMHLEQCLRDLFLQVQRHLERVKTRAPLVVLGLANVLEEHASAAQVHVLLELMTLLVLLLASSCEELAQAVQGDRVARKVGGQRMVDVARAQAHIDLHVHARLVLLVEVLSHHARRCRRCRCRCRCAHCARSVLLTSFRF